MRIPCIVAVLTGESLALELAGRAALHPIAKTRMAVQCERTVAGMSENEGDTLLHISSCDKQDSATLQKYGVKDCPGTSKKLWMWSMIVECEANTVDAMENKPPGDHHCDSDSISPEECSADIDHFIKTYPPSPIVLPFKSSPEEKTAMSEKCISVVAENAEDVAGAEIKKDCESQDPSLLEKMGLELADCMKKEMRGWQQERATECEAFGLFQLSTMDSKDEKSFTDVAQNFIELLKNHKVSLEKAFAGVEEELSDKFEMGALRRWLTPPGFSMLLPVSLGSLSVFSLAVMVSLRRSSRPSAWSGHEEEMLASAEAPE